MHTAAGLGVGGGFSFECGGTRLPVVLDCVLLVRTCSKLGQASLE